VAVVAILGSGNVTRALTQKLNAAGHVLIVGSRDPHDPSVRDWAQQAGVRLAPLRAASAQAEVAINATPGQASLDSLRPLAPALAGKVLIDIANAVETGPDGLATSLLYPGGSLAEELQRALPDTKVVKTLNTMGPASLMADPTSLLAPLTAFLSGDDTDAKTLVTGLLNQLGWPQRMDHRPGRCDHRSDPRCLHPHGRAPRPRSRPGPLRNGHRALTAGRRPELVNEPTLAVRPILRL
jgi:predicted dinucleotide-binding enzyme